MNEKEKQKYLEEFEKDVNWLKSVVPPDDVYDFAEQALMACDFFIALLGEHIDLASEGAKDKALGMWLKNICSMRVLRDMQYTGIVNTALRDPDDL